MDIIFGISGVRWVINSNTENIAYNLGKAFGSYIKEDKILVANDKRESSEKIKFAFIEGVISTGIDVIDCGFLSTPTLLYNIKNNYKWGAIITASHNPNEWNGVKFANNKGFIDKIGIEKIKNIYNEKAFNKGNGKIEKMNNCIENHINGILRIVNIDEIKSRKFSVAIDYTNGVADEESIYLLEKLNCNIKVVRINRDIEPTKNSIKGFAKYTNDVDIGFATDSDGDRLCLALNGEPLSEEYTLPLVAENILSKREGNIVTNLSTSMLIDYIANKHNSKVIRTAVGEVNVVKKMREVNAVLGGEGNGGVIDPLFHYTRDAFISMSRILEYMAKNDIKKIVENMPKYYIRKEKVMCEKINYEKIISNFKNFAINYDDGIYLSKKDCWLHIRKSNTEPIIRIICETLSEELTKEMIYKAKLCVE